LIIYLLLKLIIGFALGEDTELFEDDPDREVQAEDAKQAPHPSISDFYREYRQDCMDNHVHCCSESTFRNAYRELYSDEAVRLMGSKGGFNVCPMCVSSHNILSGGSGRRDPLVKEVTHELKRQHLKLQHIERQHAENVIRDCKKLEDGKPISFYIDIDGMTVLTCNTPRWNRARGKKAEAKNQIENRNIGARLVCGPVDAYISINTDDTIPGGGNVLVEATRICIEVLAELLAAPEYNMALPKKAYFQYDNSGENKVISKFIFICSL
jgi:hypothetical protein